MLSNQDTWTEVQSVLSNRLSPEEAELVRMGVSFRELGLDSVLIFEILDVVEEHFGVVLPQNVTDAMSSFDDLVAAVDAARAHDEV